jgi:adhesin transport system outer membrane protein
MAISARRVQALAGGVVTAVAGCVVAASVSALTVEEAIILVLETNPEITAAEASKQAIEFELDQARSLWAPRFEITGRVMGAVNDGTTAVDQSAADDWLNGYEIGARATQMLFDGYEIRSEIDRQAFRVDAAALRVLERSEFLALEAIRLYTDVLRTQQVLALGRDNLSYHRAVLQRIERAFDEGVVGIGDLQQAQERVFFAEDVVTDLELNAEDARAFFIEVVGAEPRDLSRVPAIGARLPASLDAAMSLARNNNPTIRFLQTDVGAAEALSRSIDATKYPTISLEAEARYGEDVNAFDGEVAEARVGIVARYTFQGNLNRANRQEHVRRVSESRARLLTQARAVDRETRQTWAALGNIQRRLGLIERQVTLSRELRDSYEAEFEIGNRTLLDVLNTQNALFQAQADLAGGRLALVFAQYRLLAASGTLLQTLEIEPPEDAKIYASQGRGAPPVRAAETSGRIDARSFGQWRAGVDR